MLTRCKAKFPGWTRRSTHGNRAANHGFCFRSKIHFSVGDDGQIALRRTYLTATARLGQIVFDVKLNGLTVHDSIARAGPNAIFVDNRLLECESFVQRNYVMIKNE